MSKNNKKTMNERTHNSLDLYKNPRINPDEEFAAEFDSKAKNIEPNKNENKNRQPNKNQ